MSEIYFACDECQGCRDWCSEYDDWDYDDWDYDDYDPTDDDYDYDDVIATTREAYVWCAECDDYGPAHVHITRY